MSKNIFIFFCFFSSDGEENQVGKKIKRGRREGEGKKGREKGRKGKEREGMVSVLHGLTVLFRSFSSDYQTIRHIENTHQKLKAKCNICGVR